MQELFKFWLTKSVGGLHLLQKPKGIGYVIIELNSTHFVNLYVIEVV